MIFSACVDSLARPLAAGLGVWLACVAPAWGAADGAPADVAPAGADADAGIDVASALRPRYAAQRPFDLEAALGDDAEAPAVAAAGRRLQARDPMAAQDALGQARGPAASLVQARIDLALGNPKAALAACQRAAGDAHLRPWVALAQGQAQLALGDAEAAVALLQPLARSPTPVGHAASLPLAQALAVADPAALLRRLPQLQRQRAPGDRDGRSLLLAAQAAAQARLGDADAAQATLLRQYLEEPVAEATPPAPPAGVTLTSVQALQRIERLQEAHRNEAAAAALDALDAAMPPAQLERTLACRRSYARGIVARKRHRYAEAERALGWVMDHCPNAETVRRAAFTRAKVISIQDGLRALPAIEAFAAAYPQHSMTDDVLFWAGDSLQRRGREDEAASYYRRIVQLPRPDDQCAEASWRLAWMAWRAGRRPEARRRLQACLSGRCPSEPAALARARYWLGRLEEDARRPAQARTHYEAVLQNQPLSFYAQQALPRLLNLQGPAQRRRTLRALARPQDGPATTLCPHALADADAFGRGLYLLGRGLEDDALAELRTLSVPPPSPRNMTPLRRCGPGQAALLHAQLLARAGGHKEAHARLLGDFAAVLQHFPTAATLPIWREAYPLAFRQPLAAAEAESGLPPYLLQALSREESRFDPEVVSWAEAIGLTQLLLPSAQLAGRQLTPPLRVHEARTLYDPALNARLGGALLAYYGRRLGGAWPLALAAYNGGQQTAHAWWERFGGREVALFAEEMTIFETRTYVQRVLQTFGIYRWLYAGAAPQLASAATLPAFGQAGTGAKAAAKPGAKAAANAPANGR